MPDPTTDNQSEATGRDVVVVGTSAGGVQALQTLLSALPADLPAAVFIVLHVPEGVESRLPTVLARVSALPVDSAREGDEVRHGRVLVAPSGSHLLLRHNTAQVRRGPKENGVRPSVDVLFRSAALTYGPRVISVVLTGLLDDGAVGSREVLRRGGLAFAQDPASAEYPSMPRNALAAAPGAQALALPELAAQIGRVVAQSAGRLGQGTVERDLSDEADVALAQEMTLSAAEPVGAPAKLAGEPSMYNCPDCSGVLQCAGNVTGTERRRCRVGHGWSAMALVETKAAQVESALWAAVHLLEERALLCGRLADQAAVAGRQRGADQLRGRADEAATQVELLRSMVLPTTPAAARNPADSGSPQAQRQHVQR